MTGHGCTFSERDFIIEIGGYAGVRYCRRILRRAANNSEGRHMYPAHSLITVIKAGRFQPHDRIAVDVSTAHTVVMPK